MKIYIDILLVTNCILTLIYIETLSKLTHKRYTNLRTFASSCLGGIFSLILVLDSVTFLSALVITLIKLVGLILTVLLLRKYKSIMEYLHNLLIYFIVNIVYMGVTLLYWEISGSKIIYVRNYTFYFDISVLWLVVAVISAYICLSVYELISRKKLDASVRYEAVFSSGNYELKIPAVADSGNRLCDSFTGTPVVVFYCDELFFHYNLDKNFDGNLSGFRLIPYNTISGNGLIHVTSNGRVRIIDEFDNGVDIKCYVGIVRNQNEKSRAIFNPVLLR